MRNPRIVKHQKTHVIKARGNFSGEASPYWQWVEKHGHPYADGNPQEFAQANPDTLPESAQTFPQESGLSVGDISKQLPKMQRRVFELYVQGGKSEEEIATILNIGKTTVYTHLQRIRDKYKFYV